MTAWRLVVTLLAGLLFGSGLALLGMLDPTRVLGFLDLASGHWDPSLLFVLGGALLVALPAVQLQRRLARPCSTGLFTCRPPYPSTAACCWARRSSAWAGGWPGYAPGPRWQAWA